MGERNPGHFVFFSFHLPPSHALPLPNSPLLPLWRAFTPTQPLPRQIRNRNQKFDKNITKRGNVSLGKVEDKDDFPVSKGLIAFFLFLIVGSSVVQVLNLFRRGPALEE